MASITTDTQEERVRGQSSGFADRLKLFVVSQIGFWAIRIIGKTLRWEVRGWDNYRAMEAAQKRIIYAFWHGRIFMATYFWRNRGIVVMTSQNKDGDYIARVIRRFGYGAARGSSSRGGLRALAEMIRELRGNKDVAFTVDGPRGPRYIAKPGPIWLASKSGAAVFPFNISAQKRWVLSSWDQFQIPKPFSRVVVLMGSPIYVSADASAEDLDSKQRQLQHALEELLSRGDSHWDVRGGVRLD
jgi:lysophospholipid acyltransferase (LPLAT)-like uncharacterized protein